ncbi:hypothetical protein T03_16758 [Trichinella britovi]|uniref:Uncharacterized protein n=1 Tax=Trichinella britovi TaxID=45882 RepID=A0A0V1DA32_TRIBR|nr:hypothetical protein T03_16758 [Trichinella britovi]
MDKKQIVRRNEHRLKRKAQPAQTMTTYSGNCPTQKADNDEVKMKLSSKNCGGTIVFFKVAKKQ